MKTLVSVMAVVPFRIGGQEAYAKELSLQLAQYGWRHVVCFGGEPTPAVRRYLDLPNLTIEVLQNPQEVSWQSMRALYRLLRRYGADILHLQYTPFVGPYPWTGRLAGVSKVFHTDQAMRVSLYDPKRAPLWKRLAGRVVNWPLTKVICVSEYGYRTLTAPDLLPKGRFALIYNALDFSRVDGSAARASDFRRKHSIREDSPLVLQVSWMGPEKGVPEFLRMAQAVRAQCPAARFVLVGDGRHRSEYMKLAEDLGLRDCVTWTGLVEDPFGEGVFAAADVVCQLSQCEELSPFAVAEAMASGKPVVGTLVGGIPEYVIDGTTGYVVSRADIPQLAEHVVKLLTDGALRDEMGRAGRRAAEAKFNLKHNVAELLRVYGLGDSRGTENAPRV